MKRFFDWLNNLYPVWLVTLAVIAFFKPPVMLWFNSDWVFWSLAASMLGMGLTLSLADFKAIGRMQLDQGAQDLRRRLGRRGASRAG